ncbi:NADH-quinone oxidoreductase subunit E [Shinella yambaruensis]|uniref:NADH dehydrogenase subunit E n=1 Tax=Shinella yambaruensis TaxID=415996 RepID=A0ABQ5ZD55_9HYPH|nr:NADH-quinone oxidoreductase subunit E [Shinella yambaruensis]MCJ8024349.1 NADH-quinone oxidoreductase subunit E [Shinella yambaruensis]MCU7980791.1 NADH-quinone oxidoreductase subunit E [Shinella yambaruensis]GLR49647.1 NADH dehydrogenase subunit E [Shinella yambaruensis]
MSVRRLADDNVQPASFAFTKENADWAEATINKYPKGRQQSAVIPLLMRAQEQDGWVTKAAIESVADMLGMAYIRVLEVATFYTQFQLLPVGTRAHVQVCGTTPCMLRGAEDLINVCKKRIHPEPFHLNETGTLSWEEVECQGACVNAPMIMIFKDSYEDLTATQLEHIIDRFDAGKGADVTPGPQVDRIFSAPVGGLTSLNEPEAVAKKAPARAKKTEEESVSVPPSNAAKPKTDAVETDPKLKTPATAKAEAAANAKATGDTRAEGGDAAAKQPLAEAGKPSLEDKNRPAAIARPQTPDDLKLISGVGPKIEGILHELGIFTFAQVAAWKKAEREWVDSYLNFKGRIERDDWVRQAKALAKGGEAEYIRVFGKKPR